MGAAVFLLWACLFLLFILLSGPLSWVFFGLMLCVAGWGGALFRDWIDGQ
jgi:hypothetical protein